MSVRLTNRRHVRITLLKRPGEHGSSARFRKRSSLDDTLAKLVYQLRANTSRCTQMNGVRKNTTRGGRVGESSAKATSSDPLRIRSFRRQQCRRTRRERDQPARHARKNMQPDEEYVGFPRQLGSRAHRKLDTARSASHRPTRDRGQTMDGTNTNAAARKRGATVMQGIIGVRSERKNRHEGDLEGEQGPGRVGQRIPETVLDGTDPPAEQSLEGPGPFDTTGTLRLETGSLGGSRIEDDEKSEEATTTETWNGCRRGESSGGYELRCGEPRVRVTSKERFRFWP
jgi:hypothetical protein